MEAAVEKHQPPETALQRLRRHAGALVADLTRLLLMSVMLTPMLLWAILTVDVPVYGFDRLVGDMFAARASNWLSQGGMVMGLAPLLVILVARKFGGEEASRIVTTSWGLAALAIFAELSYLAPSLEAGDFPSVRFTVAFTTSGMAAHYVAANIYDIVRGSGRWWRAPLFGALCGYVTSVLIYFPVVYWGTGAPWLNWMFGDFAIKAMMALGFLPLYAVLRKSLRPKGGFGG